MKYKKFLPAFTLAEVLIVIGIIGIIAAMTLPTLFMNFRQEQTVAKLKKEYANLVQAVKLSSNEYEPNGFWDYTLSGKNFFKKYLSVSYKNLGGESISEAGITYKELNGNNCGISLCRDAYIVNLYDGGSIVLSNSFHAELSKGKVISIDINGKNPPNILGIDFFPFAITAENGVIPFGEGSFGVEGEHYGEYSRNKVMGKESDPRNYSCSETGRGYWCAGLIMKDGWQIAKDYPWH